MSVLVVAEHDNAQLKKSTLHTVTAALKIHPTVDILVAGAGSQNVAQQASQSMGVNKVIHIDNTAYQYFLAENMSECIAEVAKNYTTILAPATTTGKNIMPRVAALLDTQQISDIISVESDNTFKRPIYAGNVIAEVESSDTVKVITVRSTAFDPVGTTDQSCPIESLDIDKNSGQSSFINDELAKSDRPELTAANTVISGGRGLANGENFNLLYTLADKLNAAVGASRAAVDAGFVPNDMQVGQTGKIVAPDLYIAVGISGAIQHLAGMKDSKVIVAINKDEDAPIFQVADYGLVADLFDVIPELSDKL